MFDTGNRIWVLGGIFVWVTRLAAAQGTTLPVFFPQVQTFGTVGLTTGQTARLNVLNPGVFPFPPLATGAASPAGPAAMCSALVSFLDSKGTVLKTAPLSVLPGQSVYLDLDRDTEVPATYPRVEIRATLQVPVPSPIIASPPQAFGCPLMPTLEIFNNSTGMTQVVMTETRSVFGPVSLPVTPAPMPNP